jgi:DnaJ-related protein SCJ1
MLRCILCLLLWACLVAVVVCNVDYYKVLGVDRDASDKDIKRQYRKLSKQWHPDKNRGDDTAHDKFVEVSEGNHFYPTAGLNFSVRSIIGS